MANKTEEIETQVTAETTKDVEKVEKIEKEEAATDVADDTIVEKTAVADSVEENKTKTNNVETTELERKIIRQVEYYFGDANLNRDKFLLEQISNNEGDWVPLTVLLTFKRLADLTTDSEVVVTALDKSENGLVEISEDRKSLRRHPERPLPERNEELRKEIQSRTAYAKGFPLDIKMTEIIDFFADYPISNVIMRKYLDVPTKTYKFKGSIFITFENKEAAQEFIDKDQVAYKDRKLLRKWQDKYIEEKREEVQSKSKKFKKKEQKPEEKLELPKGAVIHFDGAKEESSREQIREAIEKIDGEWEIAYIEYCKGNKDGHIRFHQNEIASKFIEKLGANKLELEDKVELNLRVLEGDEEQTFLENVRQQIKNRRNQFNKKGNRKRRNFHNDRNESKKAKVDSE